MQLKPQPFILALTIALLAACGGGGGGGETPTPTPTTDPQNKPTDNDSGEMRRTSTGAMMPASYSKRLENVQTHEMELNGEADPATIVYNGKTLLNVSGRKLKLDLRSLPQGYFSGDGRDTVERSTAHIKSYKGFYGGAYSHITDDDSYIQLVYGTYPLQEDLPQTGKAHYSGVAFDDKDRGSLSYDIDFSRKEGSGSISGLSRYGNITLHSATLSTRDDGDFRTYVVPLGSARAVSERGGVLRYGLELYGPQAAELGGKLRDALNTENVAVFYGSRNDQ